MILGGSAAPLRAPPCALCACARQLPGAQLTTNTGEAGIREIVYILNFYILNFLSYLSPVTHPVNNTTLSPLLLSCALSSS